MNKSIVKMITDRLEQDGYGGLVNTVYPCGCGIGDLMPCGSPSGSDCVAAYKNTHSTTGEIIYSTRNDLTDDEIVDALNF